MKDSEDEIEAEIHDTVETIKTELENLKQKKAENKGLKAGEKDRVTALKERLETLRNELLQEVMLKERCKSIKLV